MPNLLQFAQTLHERITSSHHIALIAHKSPDGDACGSLAGLAHLIRDNYPTLTVSIIIPPEKRLDTHVLWVVPDSIEYIPVGAELILLLDTSLLSRTALTPDKYPQQSIISIDHHEFLPGSIEGYRDTASPSTTMIITELAQILNWKISSQAATALLLGIYTDTGGFLHRNTIPKAFEISGWLMDHGANQSRIAQTAFGDYTLAYLQDLGKGLMSIVQSGTVACLFFHETDENAHLRTHIIGYLSGLANVDIACVLTQKMNQVKGSLRTRKDNIDVNLIAKHFGGGGHKKASGFELDATIADGFLHWVGQTYSLQDFSNYIERLTR